MNVVLIIVLVLVALRLLLPYVVLFIANRTIGRNKDYDGKIKRIRIKLLKGVFNIEGIHLNKIDTALQKESPFFAASVITISIQWKALFRKTIVGEIIIEEPKLEFVKQKAEPKEATDSNPFNLKMALKKMLPFKLDLQIKNGKVRFQDETSEPRLDTKLTDLQMQMLNVTNIEKDTEELIVKIKADARVYEGILSFNMNLNPMADRLTFDMNMEMKEINLVLLNDFLRARLRIDVNQGVFSMYTEVAAKDGGFKGYIKPVIRNLDVMGPQDRDDNLLTKLWEGFVAVAYQVLKNKTEDQVATKITIEGKWNNPHVNVLSGVASILKNAFIHALQPSLDDVINMDSVRESVTESKKFIKNIFTRKST